MSKRVKLMIVIAAIALLAAVGAVIFWSPTQNKVNAAFQNWQSTPRVDTMQLEPQPSDDSVSKNPCTFDELLVAIKPIVESCRAKHNRVKQELRGMKNQDQRDSLFLANRFEALSASAIEFCFQISVVFSETYNTDLFDTVKFAALVRELDLVGVELWYNGDFCVERVNAKQEYDFYGKYVSPKNKKYLEMVVSDHQEIWPILSDGCVMLSSDQLFNRIERCLAIGSLYDSGDALYARLTADIEQYTKLLLFCDMDNSLTFDRQTNKIDTTIYKKLKAIEIDSTYQQMKGHKLVKRYLTAIEANNMSYSEEIERDIMNYASQIFSNSN